MKECLISHNNDDWATPKILYNKYMEMNYKDPCKFKELEESNNLFKEYKDEKIFINPPFSQKKEFFNYALWLYNTNNCYIHFLIPASTSTKLFKEIYKYKFKIYFIQGRLKYNENKNGAPFSTCIIEMKEKEIAEYEIIELNDFIKKIK